MKQQMSDNIRLAIACLIFAVLIAICNAWYVTMAYDCCAKYDCIQYCQYIDYYGYYF
jgi:hypothetical protein